MIWNISIGPANISVITIHNIEHFFQAEASILVKMIAWVSLILIILSNGYLIHVIKNGMKSALDWLMLIDSFLAISNCIPIIRLGFLRHSAIPFCFILTFFTYFTNVSNRLVTIGISIYRYILVVHHMKMRDKIRKQIFLQTLFSAIIFPSSFLTGYSFYYRDNYKLYKSNVLKCI